ncbi:hypothetical protein QLQ12_11045 [Actinoplanes sp. NEAU-A12]|uniref:Uncharacterized protein n=1 Tax=Actinoplanes sandaracinus TaxID=3045177 RepID=A0ABT6WHD1_9ACTN|nr:hypothetical protein [Actinoplanes sandaracinus]MDI6099133.1 hypothetical protein [Actinoplanes sandaracinus]
MEQHGVTESVRTVKPTRHRSRWRRSVIALTFIGVALSPTAATAGEITPTVTVSIDWPW